MRLRHAIGHLIALFSVFVAFEAHASSNTYTLRDCSISSLSGSSTTLAAANPNRRYLGVFNTGNATVYVNLAGGTAASSGVSSVLVPSGSSIIMQVVSDYGPPRNAITITGTVGQPVACFEGN